MLLGFGGAGAVVSLMVVLLHGWLRGGWLEALLAGIAIGMSMLPEEFPVVLTIFMTMGAWRILRARVLTRRAAAIETLGAATVLCTDKTGTLTQNRMSVQELWVPGQGSVTVCAPGEDDVPPAAEQPLWHALLASAEEPFDPMEKAIHALRPRLAPTRPGAGPLQLTQTYGLSPQLLAMTHVWQPQGGAPCLLACKGAPEAIMGLCRLSEMEGTDIRIARMPWLRVACGCWPL